MEPAMAKSTPSVAFVILIGVAARVAFAVTDGLLPNGHFEQGPAQSELDGTRVTGRYSIPQWEISGFVEYIKSGQKQDDMILQVPEGERAVRLGNDATIRQRLTSMTRHTYYSITFSASRTCAQAEKLNVSVTPAESGVLPIQTVYTSSGWDSYSFAFKAKHSTVWLSIHNPGHEEHPACGPLIDRVAIKTLRSPHLITNNMLRNGDFEEGPYIFADTAWGVLVPPIMEDDVSPLPGWTVMSDTKVVKYVDAAHHAVPHGSYAVELVAGRECALVQEVQTRPGRSYTLSFSVGDAGNGCRGNLAVEAFAARETVRVPYVVSPGGGKGGGGHRRAELVFVASGNVTRVVFRGADHYMKADATLCGPVIDDVRLVPVRTRR